jgi:hypothetical protein
MQVSRTIAVIAVVIATVIALRKRTSSPPESEEQ